MFRAVYEVVLRGFSEELECLSRLYNALTLRGTCIGSQTMFICSNRNNTVIKVTPHSTRLAQDVQLYSVAQPLTVAIVVEGSSAVDIIDAASVIYSTVKSCGLSIKLLSD
ncbi:MAG: hypothetical protein N3D82_01260 [Ignisphaera sp.]|nr:hypothetical protein [Ignisphaera sp.]MCX8167645.1 hypothetical protein [Ignisphaera sp.]MDW8085636.1 hypothetical protein [Ignisphaera sp.]